MNHSFSFPLLVVAATKEEISPLIEGFSAIPFENGATKNIFKANRKGNELFFLVTGVGRKQVRFRLKKALPLMKPKCVLSMGTAGGVDPSLQVGDNVLGKNVLAESPQGDILVGNKRFLKYRLADIPDFPNLKKTEYSLTVNHALDKEEKRGLSSSGIGFVDMETFPIAKVVDETLPGTPLISVRAISDSAETEIPLFEELNENAGCAGNALLETHNANVRKAIESNAALIKQLLGRE